MGPALFGLLIGVTFVVPPKLVPEPAGSVVFWAASAALLLRGALICWRRTGLPFATAAAIHGAAFSVAMSTVALFGQPFPGLSPASWVFFTIGAAIGPIFLLIESRVHPAEWQAWARHMERQTVWDIVLARHIPNLRNLRT
jgi:hypothetical protein